MILYALSLLLEMMILVCMNLLFILVCVLVMNLPVCIVLTLSGVTQFGVFALSVACVNIERSAIIYI